MTVIKPGGTKPGSKPPYDDHGNPNLPFKPTMKDRLPIIGPNEWLQISSGLQTSNLNNGRWNMRRYAPWYNDKADYNTSAKSYYDYLSRLNYLLDQYRDAINQLLRREILTGETTTAKMFQDGNWESEDDITLTTIVKISQQIHSFIDHSNKQYDYSNAIWDDGLPDPQKPGTGIFAKDFTPEINDIWDNIWELWTNVKNLWNNVFNIYDILSGNWLPYDEANYDLTTFGSFGITPGDLGGKGVFIYTQDVYSGYNVQIRVATRNGSVGCTNTSSVKLGHGDHDMIDSYIFGINVTGGVLADCDFMKLKNVSQFGNSVWNITGRGNKWPAYVSAFPHAVYGKPYHAVVAIESYADGNNDQLPTATTMNTCNINLSFYVPKNKQPEKPIINGGN